MRAFFFPCALVRTNTTLLKLLLLTLLPAAATSTSLLDPPGELTTDAKGNRAGVSPPSHPRHLAEYTPSPSCGTLVCCLDCFCCGPGTSWSAATGHCVADPFSSSGDDDGSCGTIDVNACYDSPACIGRDCCGDGTVAVHDPEFPDDLPDDMERCLCTGDPSDPPAPACTDLSGDDVIEFHGGANDTETGIASVALVDGAENLALTFDPFTIGDQEVTFKANRVNDTLPATGTIKVANVAGSTCALEVALDPFDFEMFDEELGFPASLHHNLFGAPSGGVAPVYATAIALPEAAGTYQATNEDGTPFSVQISSIVLPSTELDAAMLEDTTQDLSDAVAAAGPSSFAFRGFFHFEGASVEVVALAWTFVGLASAGTGNVMAIYDPTGPFGITDPSDTVNVPLAGSGRRLHTGADNTQGGQSTPAAHERALQAESCANALGEAIDAASCEVELIHVDEVCVTSATFTYNQAVAVATGEYDTAIAAAEATYILVTIEINRRKLRDFAKQLIPCVLIGWLGGPLGYAICAARALAIVIAKAVAMQLVAEGVKRAATAYALSLLQAALYLACQSFRLALFGCVSCKTDSPTNSPMSPTTGSPTDSITNYPAFSPWPLN